MENNNNKTFKNPILPGFYPDPSICRVGEDYYLVTSSFAYFPGVPIFHSKDLVNWKQIGHVLDRPSQLELSEAEQSRGIFAPTIRYSNGLFYMITTNVSSGGNFIVTAKKPEGPWSEPYFLPDASGIDPSLFFDEDGKAYYIGTRPDSDGEKYFGNWEIWVSQLDLDTMSLVGEKYPIWKGAMKGAIWPEGPHIYKIGKYYYLLNAEGGTGHEHCVTVARSEKIMGPYEGNPCNPILTHRHLGRNYPIVNVGHGDLVETQNGEWWMVVLASRPYGGYYRNLGRETFLAPVTWENDWPIVNEGYGCVQSICKRPNLPIVEDMEAISFRDSFEGDKLPFKWNFIRVPSEGMYSLKERKGCLRLKLRPEKITELKGSPSFVGVRQRHMDFEVLTQMEFNPLESGEAAGIVLYQNHKYHYRFEYLKENTRKVLRLIKCTDGSEETVKEISLVSQKLFLKIIAKGQDLSFMFSIDSVKYECLIENVDGRILSTEIAGGFVGTFIGLYATSDGKSSSNYADFKLFEYMELSN